MENNTNAPKTVNGHRIKVNGYSQNKAHIKRERKRIEAEMRQDKRDKLSIEQKIKLAHSRRGESRRELKCLYAK